MQRIFIVGFLMLAVISAAVPAWAECSRKAWGSVEAWISYKDSDTTTDSIRTEKVKLPTITRTGFYGGGCKTGVGRQKARGRACRKVIADAKNKYKGRSSLQMDHVCQATVVRYDKKTKKVRSRIPVQKLKAEWIKMDRILVRAKPLKTRKCPRKHRKLRIRTYQLRFTCKNGKGVPLNK
jgi:hypothetical protein